jgi:hypothetical protein
MPENLKRQYVNLKRVAKGDLRSTEVRDLIVEMVLYARTLLVAAEALELTSQVNGKQYIGFRGMADSRPVNRLLFGLDQADFDAHITAFSSGFVSSSPDLITRSVYTLALTIFAANDINEVGRKASATFFEVLIGHLVARLINVNPRKKVRMPESQAELSTDYVFDLGEGRGKVHLPLKTSTRERAVQAWVHQLILDRIFGSGSYRGILVVCAETKKNSKTGQVIEICTPRQLQIFQARVAELTRLYYLDPPDLYLGLSSAFPRVTIKPFGEIFTELPALLLT